MNAKHHLKRQLRAVEASLAPLAARLSGDACKARVLTGQNGSIGVANLVMAVTNDPAMAAVIAATVFTELAELGFTASHEFSPMPGRSDQIVLVFQIIVNTPAISP